MCATFWPNGYVADLWASCPGNPAVELFFQVCFFFFLFLNSLIIHEVHVYVNRAKRVNSCLRVPRYNLNVEDFDELGN